MIERRSDDGVVQYIVVEPGDPKEPDHDVQACGQCQYVGHADFIVASPSQRAGATMTLVKMLAASFSLYDPEASIIPLGWFTLPGWSGHSMFWLFHCPECHELSVDYLHGHRLYLKCRHCGSLLHVHGDRFYAASGTPKPPTAAEEAAHIRQLRRQLGR